MMWRSCIGGRWKGRWKDKQSQIYRAFLIWLGVQLVFTPFRCYGLSVAVWWYILVRPIGGIASPIPIGVSQGLIHAGTAVNRKVSIGSKDKDGNKMKIKLE